MAIQTTNCDSQLVCTPAVEKNSTWFGKAMTFAKAEFASWKHNVKLRRDRKTSRDAFQHMLSLDDALLKDIGVTRDDISWANNLPMELNAAKELEKCRRYRIGKIAFDPTKD